MGAWEARRSPRRRVVPTDGLSILNSADTGAHQVRGRVDSTSIIRHTSRHAAHRRSARCASGSARNVPPNTPDPNLIQNTPAVWRWRERAATQSELHQVCHHPPSGWQANFARCHRHPLFNKWHLRTSPDTEQKLAGARSAAWTEPRTWRGELSVSPLTSRLLTCSADYPGNMMVTHFTVPAPNSLLLQVSESSPRRDSQGRRGRPCASEHPFQNKTPLLQPRVGRFQHDRTAVMVKSECMELPDEDEVHRSFTVVQANLRIYCN